MDTRQRFEYLTPKNSDLSGKDPIFDLNDEAKKRAAAGEDILNATLGSLMEDDGTLAVMPVVVEALNRVPVKAAASYAPIAGEPSFHRAVIGDLYRGTPLHDISLAVATPGGSGAIFNAVCNFLEPGEALLTTDYFWGPYGTIAKHLDRRVETFPMFNQQGTFHTEAFEQGLNKLIESQGRALVIFNFPCHNPTGYALDDDESRRVTDIVCAAARRAPVTFLLDFAYERFGTDGLEARMESATRMVDAGALVLVAWTASKSFAQYGARIGALVAVHPDQAERLRIFNALSFACRGTWSNCNHHGMLAITEILQDDALRNRANQERSQLTNLLSARVKAFNRLARDTDLKYPRYDSGFFVSVFSDDSHSAAERMKKDGVYVVPMKHALRVALCSTPERSVPRLVESLVSGHHAAKR